MPRDGYKLVTVEVKEYTHGEWMDFADDHDEYQNLSHLIRRAVTREMARVEHGDGFHPGDDGAPVEIDEVNVDLDPIKEAIYELENRISTMDHSLRDELRNLELATDVVPNEEEMKELMFRVKKYIPLVETEEEFHELKTEVRLPPDELALVSGKAEDITDAINLDLDADEDEGYYKYDVEQALAKLERSRGTIHSIYDGGDRRYYEVRQ